MAIVACCNATSSAQLDVLLGTDNTLQNKDLGLVHSSAAKELVSLMLDRLKHDGDV